MVQVSMSPNSALLWFWERVGAASQLSGEKRKEFSPRVWCRLANSSNNNKIITTTVIIITTTTTTKQLKEGKNKLQGFWFSTYFFGNL